MNTLFTNSIFKTILVSTLLLLTMFLSKPILAKVKASASQEFYYSGDPIILVIEIDKNNKAKPDLSPLQSRFEIKGTSASSRTNVINGNRSFNKSWKITLYTGVTGKLTIPSITVGNEKTTAFDIIVKKLPPEIAAETQKHIFIETVVDSEKYEIYVQQQIPYTIKFFYDAAMQSGEVILPEVENANMRILGREKKYQVVRAGNKYVVVEKRFVLSAEKSGKLIIPPSRVEGRIALTGGDSAKLRQRMDEVDMLNELFFDLNNRTTFTNPFDPFFSRRSIGPTRPFSVSSEPIEINVLPVPDSFKGSAWLPAKEIKMQDSWAENPPELKVGEPVTRTIIMQVKGLASSQIPEIEIPKPEGIKIYPEQATTETPNDGNTIYGIQRVDISYIPDSSGKVIIPEIKVDWWDVNAKKQRKYTLPAWNLNIATAEDHVTEQEKSKVLKNIEPVSDDNSKTETTIEEPSITKEINFNWNKLFTILAIGSAILLFFSYAFKRYIVSSHRVNRHNQKLALAEILAIKESLLKACKQNDKTESAALLIEYAKRKLNDPYIQNLGLLVSKLASGTKVVKQLEVSLYATNTQEWKGNDLKQLIEQGLKFKEENEQIDAPQGLAPLYPY